MSSTSYLTARSELILEECLLGQHFAKENLVISLAELTVDTPVAGEQGRDAGRAGAVGVAVKEGEVGGHKVRAILHPDGELGGEVGLSAGDEGQQVVPEI